MVLAQTSHDLAGSPDDIRCPSLSGQQDEKEENIVITMAGAEPAQRLVHAWSQVYTADYCPGTSIHTQAGGYAMGAARVCDNHAVYRGVDVGGMMGEFFYPQASSPNGWDYDCKHSERQVALVCLYT